MGTDQVPAGQHFGEMLLGYRQAAGLSQEELAERSGLSVRAISNLERGRTIHPHPRTVRSLADALALRATAQEQLDRASRRVVIDADPAGRGPGGLTASGAPRQAPVPQQLPAAVSGFTARARELNALTAILDQAGDGSATTVISAIAGTAGVGKTALAVQWAHQVAARFPDGQLYLNLRGYDPGQPVAAADALARFMRALGVPSQEIPADPDECAAQYRSLLAERRLLILLDNAGSADQVRALLPAVPGCAAVITSRDSLAGLIARDGARRLDLDLLPLADAITLLRTLIGDRVDAEPEAAAALARHCCRLPLALRVAAELAAARPAVSLASLAGELASRRQRLDLLDADGDPRTAVRVVFSWSLRHLDPGTARAFRLLGLHPGPDFDRYAAAALTGASLPQASLLLDHLVRAHLIQATGPGRYAMHDLLRDYARELAAAEDGPDDQRAAVSRLLDYYLHAAGAAMDAVYPAAPRPRPALEWPPSDAPPLAEPDAARAWLAAELPCLTGVTGRAATDGWPWHATQLARTLFRYLNAGAHFPEAVTMHGHARSAARQMGDVAAEAEALTMLGAAELRQGRGQNAAHHFEQALPLSRHLGDRAGEARALGSLGNAAYRQGRYEQAAGHYQLVLSLCQETGHRVNESIALGNIGAAELRLGQLEQAATHLAHAVDLSHDVGQQGAEARALINLGEVSLRQHSYAAAARYLGRGLGLCRDAGHRVGEAHALTSLGELDLRQGRYQEAADHLQEALAIARDTGAQPEEAAALGLLGDVVLAAGAHEQARAHYAGALALASQTGDTYWQARAHDGIARARHAGADLELARDHWQQALALYTEMGTPEAAQVAAQLAGISIAD